VNKGDLIDKVAAETGLSKAKAKDAVDAVLDQVMKAVRSGDTVQLIGFGTFTAATRAARKGRNPATGEDLEIKESNTVKFTVGSAFKSMVNSNEG
jgi:DNA-binding protein HU-beta